MVKGEIDNLTMEQYIALTRGNHALELREDTFSGNKNDDAHEHVERVLDIVSLFNIPKVTHDAVMSRVFPITLTRAAKRWTAKKLEEIRNFKQEGYETLYQAWERCNNLLYKCPTHDINSDQKVNIFYNGLGIMNRQLLDSQGPIPGMTPAQALTAIQKMADHSQKWHDGSSNKYIKGCQNCGGAYLDKDCPLNEEVKRDEEAKHGELGRSLTFNNGAKYRVGPPRYYTRIYNRPLFREKRPSLEEIRNKHLEESTRRRAEMEEWVKKLQENSKINTRNQSASLKNLDTQIEQLSKKFHKKTTNEINNSSFDQRKAVYANEKTPLDNKQHEHEVSFISNKCTPIVQEKVVSSKVLPCQLPPKEMNPRNFTLLCTIGSLNFYAMSYLGASVNVIPKSMFEHLKLAQLKKTGMLDEMTDITKRSPIKIVENALVKIDKKRINEDGLSFPEFLLVKLEETQEKELIWDDRFEEWCSKNPNTPTLRFNTVQENLNPRPKDYPFKEWLLTKNIRVISFTLKMEILLEPTSNKLMSDQAEERPKYALNAYSFSSSDSEVSNDSNCSKSCMETVKLLKSQNDQLLRVLDKSSLIVLGEITIRELRKKLEKIQKEKDSIQFNVDKFENASKSLNKLIECQIVDNCKKGLGYETYDAIPAPYIGNFKPPTPDLSFTGLDEFVNKPVVENRKSSKEEPKVVRKNDDALIIEECVSDDKEEDVSQPNIEKKTGNPQMDLQDQVVIDSGCSGHMTGNMSYLTDYEEIDGRYVAFGGNPKGGKITRKILVRAATTASSLEAEQDSGNITKTRSKATPNESSSLGTTSGGVRGYYCSN
ncbi:hypothetical protein Tco_0606386 [Tanacetum coccineum]